MQLTPELKAKIDGMSYEQLLRRRRFSPLGDPVFEGEPGDYWGQRMMELRESTDHVAISKRVGWGD